jgi:hypothetical protein
MTRSMDGLRVVLAIAYLKPHACASGAIWSLIHITGGVRCEEECLRVVAAVAKVQAVNDDFEEPLVLAALNDAGADKGPGHAMDLDLGVAGEAGYLCGGHEQTMDQTF